MIRNNSKIVSSLFSAMRESKGVASEVLDDLILDYEEAEALDKNRKSKDYLKVKNQEALK